MPVGRYGQVEAGIRLRSPIIIPVVPLFRYRQNLRTGLITSALPQFAYEHDTNSHKYERTGKK